MQPISAMSHDYFLMGLVALFIAIGALWAVQRFRKKP
jgi:hypothetical protein